jgi:hypothetical protein
VEIGEPEIRVYYDHTLAGLSEEHREVRAEIRFANATLSARHCNGPRGLSSRHDDRIKVVDRAARLMGKHAQSVSLVTHAVCSWRPLSE